jgi:hypothetical protein
MLMRPISLHRRLARLGIESENPVSWRQRGREPLYRAYVLRGLWLMIAAIGVLSSMALGLLWLIGMEVDFGAFLTGVAGGVAGGVAFGVAVGVAGGVAGGVAWGVAGGVAVGVAVGVAGGVAVGVAGGVAWGVAGGVAGGVAWGVAFGVAVGVAYGVAGGVAYGVAGGVAYGVAGGVAYGVAVGVAYGVAVGVAYGVAVGVAYGVAVGVAFGVAFEVAYLRLPLYLFELPLQLIAYAWPSSTRTPTLAWSPVLHHELSYLPLPLLARHIVDTASRDPALARRALDACAIAPGQRGNGRRALSLLRARELRELAQARRFQALMDLETDWLPDPDAADARILAFRETARFLRSATLTLIPGQRRAQLEAAQNRLRGLENRLLGSRDLEARIYRPVVGDWQCLVDAWLAETAAEAARELPNPFRAGKPLDPEFGLEVFRGREPLVAELEKALGDPDQGTSIALIGPRRCGKTSLIKMLPLKLADAQVLFFDLQDHPVDSAAAFVRALVREAKDQARRDRQLQLPDLPEGPPIEALAGWLDALEAFDRVPHLLLCIDEYERLDSLYPGDRRALLQLLGLLRATIQHRRRVRLLIAGTDWLDELDRIWSDHFINLHHIGIGHLDRTTVLELLQRPSDDFPANSIPENLADWVWQRTRGQPYLTQLFGQCIVSRLNQAERRTASIDDGAAVEPEVIDKASQTYLCFIARPDSEPARAALDSLAAQGHLDPATLDRATRRYLLRRGLIETDGSPGIPLLLSYLAEYG